MCSTRALAPRGQLPYLVDDDETIGDSDAIIAHLKRKYALTLDDALTGAQRDLDLLIRRTLDDLYWVMSYSRWRDDRYWPQFRDALLRQHPDIGAEALEGARKYNFERYRYQGIGRYEPDAAYARGIASLQALANLLGDRPFMFGDAPASIDSALYGFVASIGFTTSIRRSSGSSPRRAIWSRIAARCASAWGKARRRELTPAPSPLPCPPS